jgi:putative flippase GtrA
VSAESTALPRRVVRLPRIPVTFLRYAAVGLLSLVVDAGTLWLLYDVAHQHLWLATSAGFWLSFAVNFIANKYLTFSATTGGRRQLLRYAVVVGVSYLSNLAIVTWLVMLGMPAVVGKLIAIALLTVVNFGAYRYWVFRD